MNGKTRDVAYTRYSSEVLRELYENRQQKVGVNNVDSATIRNDHSVPQGSKLVPLLFLLHINDMIHYT